MSFGAVREHYARFFTKHAIEVVPAASRARTLLPGLDVAIIDPGPRTRAWTYATIGASQSREGAHACEFFVLSGERDDSLLELVSMAAFYHATGGTYRLGVGHLVNIGHPWREGSSCKRLLVSRPYTFGPELEICADEHGHLHVLWLLPITDDEREYALAHGVEALESLFEDVGLAYLRVDRASALHADADA